MGEHVRTGWRTASKTGWVAGPIQVLAGQDWHAQGTATDDDIPVLVLDNTPEARTMEGDALADAMIAEWPGWSEDRPKWGDLASALHRALRARYGPPPVEPEP